ncbi:related to tol protein [Fusarium fujikuroi IMI 58289]|uniref:Related to tol protein n=1 Tax=Gibberella fujikuroi (strain CBS 195.34 / IMI 58289 / NRRL A-6831) TaxID=1279085 RepID=S0EN77_GIBF5|nr:related to tol protein [Fusarium fujikuroi IMI 58289]CCT76122.1 related to tol protein [Fusarium fujikuroi IMI 58289]SCO27017.1 related to tol protein [Fusarium fujikuroi]
MSLLCEYCSKVPLSLQEINSRKHERFKLGPWPRIFTSPCPLCQLIQSAYLQERRINSFRDDLPSSDATLSWIGYGPGRRPAYIVSDIFRPFISFAAKTSPHTISTIPSDQDMYYLCSLLETEIDVWRVFQWLSECTKTHGGECSLEYATFSSAFPGLHVLRLLDVQQNCLVEVQNVVPYLALSYIWGAVRNIRLTQVNLNRLLIPGSIKGLNGLPRTVRDAIELTRKLGVQYLWIDALCLIQNDMEDLERGINVMDLIYERSLLTIIAASGNDADAGLPGVRARSRQALKQTVEVKPGISLGLYMDLSTLLKASSYSSRGWTFQEQILSRRALYFLDNKVFFQCRNMTCSEAVIDQSEQQRPKTGQTYNAIHMEDPVYDYANIIENYTTRALTNPNDALRAMAGIIRRFSAKMNYRFIEGLPTQVLDAFIVFQSRGSCLHRRPGFPSYSWCRWQGHISIETPTKDEWFSICTWIVWYKRTPSGVISLIRDPTANSQTSADDAPYIGCRQRPRFDTLVLSGFPTTHTTPTEIPPLPSLLPPYPLLQFWTLSLRLKLINLNVFTGQCHIQCESGTDCGVLFLDGFEDFTVFFSSDVVDVIVLSEHVDMDGYCYNVMLLEYSDGLAERRGVGHIYQECINNSFKPEPIWKEIILA